MCTVVPTMASSESTVTRQNRSSPWRWNVSLSATSTRTTRSPDASPRTPASPLPFTVSDWPECTPAGIFTSTVSREGVRPWPSQVSHGLSTTLPEPWHAGHVVWVCIWPKIVRCTSTTRPVPWHLSHVFTWPPSATPVPPQSSHGARRSYAMVLVQPAAASSSVILRVMPMSRPRVRAAREEPPPCPPPKNESKMSLMPKPPPKMSDMST